MAQKRQRIAVGVILLIGVFAIDIILAPKKVAAAPFHQTPELSTTSNSEMAFIHEAAPPAPEQDTCQHCHLSGSIEDLWTPAWSNGTRKVA